MSKKSKQRRIAALQDKSRTVLRRLKAGQAEAEAAGPLLHETHVQERLAVTILADGRTADHALSVGEAMTTQATIWITDILATPGPGIACQPGCAWCCTLPVAVSPPEALLIAHYLRSTLQPEALAAVQARLTAQAARLAPMTIEEHAEAVIPCALLEDNRCTVYEARPVACRTYHSPDPALYQAGQRRPWASAIPHIGALDDVFAATQIGTTAGLLCSGVSAASLELHSAVARALETPRAAERWAQGEPVFQGCTRSDRINDKLEQIFADIRPATIGAAR
jgi:hypothetical protein